MRAFGVGVAILAIAAVAAVLRLAMWSGVPLLQLFLSAHILTQMIDIVLVFSLGAAVLLGFVARGPESRSIFTVLGCVATGLGAIGCLLALFEIWAAVKATHTTNFMVVAPSVAEALLPLTVALVVGALALLVAPGRPAATARA